jgi:DNA-binding NarL/FixJ family response regulator
MNPTNGIKIAVVEDSSLIAQSLRMLLNIWGYEVVLNALHGRDLFRQLTADNAPDICITDINMPVMNGYETMKVLKKEWPGIRIIAFSGDDGAENLAHALAAGADMFVSKSVPFKVLETALQTISNRIKRLTEPQ